MGTRISIIGAGSAVFSLSIIRDICLTPNLQGSTVTFMDIDEERLDAAYRLCQRYADEVDTELDLRKTTDRRQALQGAEFVINTALVSGHRAMQEGWEIAHKHGYRFGGSYHITHDEAFWINYYQYRFFEDVIADMVEICPDAWHLLVANPVLAGVTFLSRKYPQHKLVGLCHGYSGPGGRDRPHRRRRVGQGHRSLPNGPVDPFRAAGSGSPGGHPGPALSQRDARALPVARPANQSAALNQKGASN